MRGLPVTGRSTVELGTVNRTPAVLYEDFINFGQGKLSTTATGGEWFVGGTNAVITNVDQVDVVVADGTDLCGVVDITTTAASGDETFLQLEGAPFLCAVGRKIVFSTRVRLDTITTCNQTFGMYVPGSVTAAGDPEDTQANGFGFFVEAGVVKYQAKNAATTLVNTAAGLTLTASTTTGWHTFEIYWDGVNALEFWVDRTRLITYTGTAIPLNLYLSPVLGISTSSAVVKNFKCDWVYAAAEAPLAGR
jgi:hypothetical protein